VINVKKSRAICLVILGCLLFSSINLSYPTGAPAAHTGAAGEDDCSNCHFGDLGETPPVLKVAGLSDVIRAGSHLVISLKLSHPEMQVAGIQATIRSLGDSPGPAGQLNSDQLMSGVNNGIAYLNHVKPLQSDAGTVTVILEWNVPELTKTAVFNAAMVAANNDFSPFGDSVVKLEQTIEIRPR
jgi:hypothetical protein